MAAEKGSDRGRTHMGKDSPDAAEEARRVAARTAAGAERPIAELEAAVKTWTRRHPWMAVATAAAAGYAAAGAVFQESHRPPASVEEMERRVFGRKKMPKLTVGFLLGEGISVLLHAVKPAVSDAFRVATGRSVAKRPRAQASLPPAQRRTGGEPGPHAPQASGGAAIQQKPVEKSWWNLLKETFNDWSEDNASTLGAALAYYAVFSLAPVLVMAVMIAGVFFGERMAQEQVSTQLQQYLGQQGAEAVQTMMSAAFQGRPGTLAWGGSILVLLFGATGGFAALQDSLDTIWEVQPKNQGIWTTVRARALSFLMVLGIGVLLLGLLVLNSVVGVITGALAGVVAIPPWAAQAISFTISFVGLSVLFALIFKVLPDVEIAWKDVGIGAVATALLFALGMYLFGLYIGHSSMSSAYGAIGSVLIVLLWAYYSAQILLLGAEFTQVYARMYGSRIRPQPPAQPMTAEARAEMGMAKTP